MIYVLSFRDNERISGGAVFDGQLQQWDADGRCRVGCELVSELASEPRITFLIHGFDVNRPKGRDSLQRLASMLNGRVRGGIVATLWPGDSFLRALSYSFEGHDADDTAENLTRFIVRYLQPAPRLSFVTHSLGARVAMGAISGLLEHGIHIDQVCLMAPAIDGDSLADSAAYRDATMYSKRVGVLHSRKDRVLSLAYPLGDLLQAFLFFRDSPGLALGFNGPKEHDLPVPDNVIDVSLGHRNVRHGDYLPPAGGGRLNENQKSAAGYACDVLTGVSNPKYL